MENFKSFITEEAVGDKITVLILTNSKSKKPEVVTGMLLAACSDLGLPCYRVVTTEAWVSDNDIEKGIVSIKNYDGEEKDIYYYHERSAINTVSKMLADKRKTKPREIIKKKSKSLNKIIESSPYNNKKINFMSIDIENYEYEALKYFNFQKYEIDLIVTECIDINQHKLETHTQSLDYILNTKLYKLLEQNNYKLINWVNSDLVFVRKSLEI